LNAIDLLKNVEAIKVNAAIQTEILNVSAKPEPPRLD
jgi:hypothetical protein